MKPEASAIDGSEQIFYAVVMSEHSAIEWTDATWNPVTGCTQISPGCDHCYALAFAERFRGVAGHPYEQGFDLTLWPNRLELPLRWKRPRRIFVNSMSDLFHERVPDEFIRRVFDVMAQADWHTFQVLTKRPRRMARMATTLPWPPHIWAGTSVELNRYAWRANDCLRRVPAAVRFVSAEPLLGPLPSLQVDHLHWLIVGGESGRAHRPCDQLWVRDLRNRCSEAGVAFFLKQWGGRTPKAGGRILDDRTWDEMPRVASTGHLANRRTGEPVTEQLVLELV
jgi:protein gp37